MTMLNKFMEEAIAKAREVKKDIPVCAVIVKDNKIISIKTNKKEEDSLVTSHAEILALNEANKKLGRWRLDDCDIYVTLEPCPMCMWAILSARIKNLYFGSYDYKYGAAGSAINLAKPADSKINIKGGIKELECNKLLKDYFRELRK